jgi:hypothetical protein
VLQPAVPHKSPAPAGRSKPRMQIPPSQLIIDSVGALQLRAIAIARAMKAAQDQVRQIEPFTSQLSNFDVASAYEVAHLIHEARCAEGAVPIGDLSSSLNATGCADWLPQRGGFEPPRRFRIRGEGFNPSLAHYSARIKSIRSWREVVRLVFGSSPRSLRFLSFARLMRTSSY